MTLPRSEREGKPKFQNPLREMPMPTNVEIMEIIEALVAFRDAREWKQFHTPRQLAAALAIEVDRTPRYWPR